MKRGGPLKRTPLKPGRKGFRTYEGQAEFRDAVFMRDGECVRSGGMCVGPLDAHHLIPKATLTKHGHAGHADDPANGVTLCRQHHDWHHTRLWPLSWVELPDRAKDFADALGLLELLASLYPRTEDT